MADQITLTCASKDPSVACLGSVTGSKEQLREAFRQVPWENGGAECWPCAKAKLTTGPHSATPDTH